MTPEQTTPRQLPTGFALAESSHQSPEEGMCLMEAVAYIAGEPHSDHPKCACQVLTGFGIRLNDRFTDEERQLLAPLIPKLVWTRSSRSVELRRSYSLIDSSVRAITPMAMDVVGWKDLGDRLRALSEITDEQSARAARSTAGEVRDEASKRRYSGHAYAGAATSAADAGAYAYAAAAAAYAEAEADAAYAAYAEADAADAAYAAAYAAADAAAGAAAATADADAGAYASAAAYTPSRARRLEARRPVILATIAAFEKAIAITEAV